MSVAELSSPVFETDVCAGHVRLHQQDCIDGMRERIEDSSIDLTVTSIPFEELFTYSGKTADVGNNGSTVDCRHGRFALNMRFVIEQLLRVTKSGCNVVIHVQQLLAYKNQHGFMGRRDFRGAIIDLFRSGGFLFVGETAIPKDPQQMAQRLNLHCLQFKTGWGRSSTDWAMAPNDYGLIFQKPGDVVIPVRCLRHKENPDGWVTQNEWIKWASGCWDDIQQLDILDGWKSARETDEEKHVCPLQLEFIRRMIAIYTNPIEVQADVTVLDPFMGIGSTAWVALGGGTISGQKIAQRNSVGFELKESYFQQSTRNMELLQRTKSKEVPERSLFDSVEV